MSTDTIATHPGAFVNGAEHANGGEPLPITNPATGEVFAEVPGGTEADVDAAVDAAARAGLQWSALAVSRRGEILGAAAHHVEAHLDELVPLLTREQGKTLRDARIELTKAVDTLRHYVGLSKTLRGVHTPGLDPGVDGIVLRRPLGVVGAIVPWNFPDDIAVQQARPRGGGGQHGGGQTGGDDAADDAALRRAPRRRRPARRRVQRGHRQRLGHRHRARPPPGRAQDRVHRFHAGRRADHGAGRARVQARDPGARRL